MFKFPAKDKKKAVDEKIKNLNSSLKSKPLSEVLDNNISVIKEMFKDDDTLRTRFIQNNHNSDTKYFIAYLDGLVNSIIINDSIMKPLMLSDNVTAKSGKNQIDHLTNSVIMINEVKKVDNFKEIVESITYGDTVLFVDGTAEAVILNTKGFQTRSISEPDSEKTLSGPREGFCEAILMNLSLIRRKIRSNDLKMKFYTFGERTNTKACICYMDSIVNKSILKELYRRLKEIEIDGMLDTNYITELIRDAPYSPFRTVGYTERPDVVVGKILEGRIAIFLDGTPVILTVPYLFIENFQSNEDYYLNFYYTSFSRILRVLGFLLTITIPAFYVSIVGFHHEMLPTPLLVNIAIERSGVPLPASLEAFLMLLVFDILRETGVRMPSSVGQALSIVGALVIGQSAVEAKLVSAPMIIVVALTGITSLLVPKMNAPVIYVRSLLLLLSCFFGLVGLTVGLSILFVHLLNMRSFGVSQFISIRSLQYQEIKDMIIRAPWWKMITRPNTIAKDKVRMKNSGEKQQ